ncbi:MAG: methyltransferase, FxLD system [Dactylosporangium sp.]|nr:methyltransferase, FxLD system [Dactylosporangium sp.]NNJ60382.1 methyltransferase, FxLD system [Dactylosporangium sp.]
MTNPAPATQWRQLNLTCDDWAAAEQMGISELRPLLGRAQDAGAIGGWWFVRKGSTWRVRLRAVSDAFIDQAIGALTEHGPVRAATETIYEPETHAFGGPAGMDLTHEVFEADSRYLLDSLAADRHTYRRELAVILSARLLRAAGLDLYEQGDCWACFAEHRTITPQREPSPAMVAAVRQLITATDDRPDSPLHTVSGWTTAVEDAGRRLADLAGAGQLTRGLRAVLAHHLLFLFNRHGISGDDQYLLATAARRAAFGPSPDRAGSVQTSTVPGTGTATLTTVTTDAADHAARLRDDLADSIKGWGTFRTPQVEAAFRTVPRHLFLPGVDLAIAYGTKPVVTRRTDDGTSISSASSPKLVATMLEQLDARTGQRVLEIGAATGINAALLAELVGPTGTVVTIELDADLAASAAANLHRAGYPQVKVICGDGAQGRPEHAPYDRIIVTAEAWDVVGSWWEQLAPCGRIVVPIRLHGSGLTRAIAFDLTEADRMVSTSAVVCGFVPMRGQAEHDERHVRLADDAVLKVDAEDLPGHPDLERTLTHPDQEHWTGIQVRHDEPAEHLDLWLLTTTVDCFGRLSVGATARVTGLANPAPRWGGAALYDNGCLAYLATRDLNDDTMELGLIAHGPDSTKLISRTVDLLHQWDGERPAQPAITAYRAGRSPQLDDAQAHIVRPHSTFAITW